MAPRLVILFVLMALPAWGQGRKGEIPHTVRQVINADGTEDTLVTANGVTLGYRMDRKTGQVWMLREERNPFTLGLSRRLRARRAGPFPPEHDVVIPPVPATVRDSLTPAAALDVPIQIDILMT
jgi:hypothetical protein